MDVVAPPPPQPGEKPVPAPEKPADKPAEATTLPKPQAPAKPNVTSAIVATVIIVVALAVLAVYAFIKQK